jgi:hypothetical protein
MQWWILSSNCKARAKGRAWPYIVYLPNQIKCKLFISWSVINHAVQHEQTHGDVIQLFLLKGTIGSDYPTVDWPQMLKGILNLSAIFLVKF